MWGVLPDEKSGLYFSVFARYRQRSLSQILSPTGLMSIVYCLYFWDSSNLEGQVPVFISPRNKVAELYPRALGWSIIFVARR
jgi:hypothetical protein